MKVLVDTPIWSCALRSKNNDCQTEINAFTFLIRDQRALIIGPIRQEILSGYSDLRKLRIIKEKLSYFANTPILDVYYELAAALSNKCRKKEVQGSHPLILRYIQGGKMKFIVLAITVCYFLAPSLACCDELTLEKKAAIKELLQVTGATQMGELFGNAFAQQMMQILKKSKPDIDPKAFDIVKEEAESLIHEELVVKESLHQFMYPIYHRYLTLEETNGLIRFYKTPLGRKAISVMPKMAQEGMKAGQEWGQLLGPKFQQKVLARLKKEGIKIDR